MNGPAIWPRWTSEELVTAGLFEDGMLRGWVKRPTELWTPTDELLYQPPDAVKSGDFDRIGSVESFDPHPFDDSLAWVESQIRKADAYRERILGLVKAGKMQLTAALRAFLGLDDDEEHDRSLGILERGRSGALVAAKTAQQLADVERIVAEGKRLAGMQDEGRVKAIAHAAADRFAATGDMSAALDYMFKAVRSGAAPIDPEMGLPILPGSA